LIWHLSIYLSKTKNKALLAHDTQLWK